MSYFKLIRLTFALLAAVLSATMYNIFIKKEPSPTVKVKGGEMRGIIMKSRGGRDFYGYLGIPFALPATGSLRFQSPVPFPAWEGVWDASFNRPMCAQFDFMVSQIKLGSEDCLYLNVYAPANIPDGKKLPVLVYIHGGYFHCGGTAFPGAHNFMDQNVVVVVLSYRLGALGFLNTGDGVVRGNAGLKDQNLALKWVQENIAAFNGDKAKVTLVGESAGGASIHYHMLSPASKGYYLCIIRETMRLLTLMMSLSTQTNYEP